jgi:hypothetical protein
MTVLKSFEKKEKSPVFIQVLDFYEKIDVVTEGLQPFARRPM